MNNALKAIFESAEALNENGLHVLAMIAGVIRQVAPSSAVEPVALPETPSAPSSAVESSSPSETSVEPVAVPETSSAVAPETSSAPSSPTYRLVLNVPEIGLKGFAD